MILIKLGLRLTLIKLLERRLVGTLRFAVLKSGLAAQVLTPFRLVRSEAARASPRGGLFFIFRDVAFGTDMPCRAALIALLIPARQFDSRQYGRITWDLVEGVAVNDPHVPSITELNDTPRGQGSKCSSHSLKRYSGVPSDVRAIHRQRDFGDLLAFGNVELFDELQKHREFSDSSFLAEQKGVALRLPQFLAQLADNMKVQLGILGKLAAQQGDWQTIRGNSCYRLG